MTRIIPHFDSNAELKIGEIAEFEIIRSSEQVETRTFVIQQNIHYLKPLTEWNTANLVRFFPESPGSYTLLVQWRYPGSESGWTRQVFQVTIGRKISLTPQQVQVDGQTFVWAPSEWEALHLKGYETPVANLLPSLIHPGQTIYDLGANLGIYSIWFSRLAGPRGRVYSIEANPLCVYFLQANLALNQVWNCEILPVAVADSPGSLDFTINYGNSALGITQESGFYASKIGHEITVASFALDELIESLNLASPDVVKIDIEGAEEYAIIGMQKTLARCHPLLILEVHGRQAAHPTFRRLHDLGYCFQEIAHKQTFETLDSLLAWLPEAVLQFLCSPLV